MTEPADRSAQILKASEQVGLTPKQNLEFLVDFAQRNFRSLDKDQNFEIVSAELWDQWCVLVWRMMGTTFLPADVYLTAKEIRDVQAVIFFALTYRAKGEKGGIRFDQPIIVTGSMGKLIVEPQSPADDHTTSFLFACSKLLFEQSESLQIAFCAYSKCPRGRDHGNLGETRRLFVQNRHSKYCSRACGNNAASDRYLANPNNKKNRLENRKRLRSAKPADRKRQAPESRV
jgi:hypothetical protein